MSIEDEELLIGEVLKMKEQGFETSKAEVLPSLYMRIYGQMYRTNCPGCVRDAFEQVVRWASKKKSTNNKNSMSAYKFKHEYMNKNFPIRVKGQRIFVNSDNLTDDRAQILLAIPKYKHVLEPTGQGVAITTPVTERQKAVKPEKDQIIAPNLSDKPESKTPKITPEMEVESSLIPNESTGKESVDTSSTSKEVKIEGKSQKGKPGPKPKTK